MSRFAVTRVLLPSLIFAVFTCVFPVGSVSAGCLPAYAQETFRKVFRTKKIYFEGLTDINGDGKLDAYGYQLQPNDNYRNIIYVLNNGAGGFGDPVTVNTSFDLTTYEPDDRRTYYDHVYHAVEAGNLNNDDMLDFVVRKEGSSPDKRVFVTFLSGPGGTYTQGTSFEAFSDNYIAAIADLDGDSRGDLVITQIITASSTNQIYIKLANIDGTFAASQTAGGLRSWISPVVADFNADGKPDIAYTYNVSQFQWNLRVMINNGSAVFTDKPLLTNIDHSLTGVADINGDGKKDIYGRDIFLNDGTGNFTKADLPTTPAADFPTTFYSTWGTTEVMDYDGDGKKDLVIGTTGQQVRDAIGRKYFEVYRSDGTSLSKTIVKRPFIGRAADMNGDGKDEEVILINSNKVGPEGLSYSSPLRMSGSNEAAIIVRENTCTPPPVHGQTKLLDFGGDGLSDIALWNPGSGQWRYYSNLTEGTVSWGGGAFGDTPAPGDFDGDGKTDISVFRGPTGDWWIYRSSDATVAWTHFGASGDKPVPADYNGDGKTDIGVFRPSIGDWYIDYSDSPNYTFLHFGATGDIPVPADFDGDGGDNICIFRPSNGFWYYLTPTFDNYVGAPWGTTGDIPVPADYDMDGKADFAVYRPASREWYMFRSFDYGFDYAQPHYGTANDIPMAIDSDGDGIVELTTYLPPGDGRPAGWFWALSRPSSHLFETWVWGEYGAANETPLRLKLSN